MRSSADKQSQGRQHALSMTVNEATLEYFVVHEDVSVTFYSIVFFFFFKQKTAYEI